MGSKILNTLPKWACDADDAGIDNLRNVDGIVTVGIQDRELGDPASPSDRQLPGETSIYQHMNMKRYKMEYISVYHLTCVMPKSVRS